MSLTNVRTVTADERTAEFQAVFRSEAAFRTWYDDVLPRVYGYALAHAAGERDLAEDITQLTFVEAVRDHDRYDGRADPVTWLCAIARNKLADHYRRLDRQARRHLRLVVREIPTAGDDTPWRSVDERDRVESALRALPTLQRRALVLSYVDGLPVREIARVIGRSESATESLLSRARAGFRLHYGEVADA